MNTYVVRCWFFVCGVCAGFTWPMSMFHRDSLDNHAERARVAYVKAVEADEFVAPPDLGSYIDMRFELLPPRDDNLLLRDQGSLCAGCQKTIRKTFFSRPFQYCRYTGMFLGALAPVSAPGGRCFSHRSLRRRTTLESNLLEIVASVSKSFSSYLQFSAD